MTEIDFETQIQTIANRMDYPRTPNIGGHVMMRIKPATKPRVISKAAAWSLITILLVFSSLFLIPPARAAIIDFVRIGIVQIFKPEPTSTPAPIEQQTPIAIIPLTAMPAPTTQSPILILDRVLGRTTLEQAVGQVYFPILLPAYPADLGQPDLVYVQDADGALVIIVWLDPENPERVKMSLHIITSTSWTVRKFQPTVIEETKVNGLNAAWTTGPYPLQLTNRDIEITRLINGHVLIWTDDKLTYRLETDLPLDQAITIAESLQPIP